MGALHAQSLEEEKPLLTVACISDIHTERSLIDCANLNDIALRGSFVNTLNTIREEEDIDVLIMGGDCTSDATISLSNWQHFRKLMVEATRTAFHSQTSTPVLYVTGNHDYEVANWDNIPKPFNAADYYSYPMKEDVGVLSENDAFYEYADNGSMGSMKLLAAYHYVIKGFDFVVLNGGKLLFQSASNYAYSEESVQWIANKLEEIYADAPEKTVFFMVHIPFSDSNSIRSTSKGIFSSASEKLLKKTLSKYPNLMMFYGHDHGEDKSYTRQRTSQRVTRYNTNGEVIATTDETHVDVEVEGMETKSFYLKNSVSGDYLGFNSYNLAPVDTKVKIDFIKLSSKSYHLELNASHPTDGGNFVHIGTNGYFSGGEASELFIYELNTENATIATRTNDLKAGHAYMIVGRYGTGCYALSNKTYNSGESQRMQRVEVSVSSMLETLALSAPDESILWYFEDASGDMTTPAEQEKEVKWFVRSYDTNQYLGFNSLNLGAVDDAHMVSIEVMNSTNASYSISVSGSSSEANGNYIISSSNGRFSANKDCYPTYLYKVTEMNESKIIAEKVDTLETNELYLIVAENAKDRSLLYALTNKGYPTTNSNRLEGIKVTPTNGVITLSSSQTQALWRIEAVTEEYSKPSFFSAYMGSMRYYYNTIDPGDMPIETPNIVQALMVYVYTDRVELHMKNYNRYGTINGITVNKELAPYVSYRQVDIPAQILEIPFKKPQLDTPSVYDLMGRKVDESAEGILIMNGKKVLVK